MPLVFRRAETPSDLEIFAGFDDPGKKPALKASSLAVDFDVIKNPYFKRGYFFPLLVEFDLKNGQKRPIARAVLLFDIGQKNPVGWVSAFKVNHSEFSDAHLNAGSLEEIRQYITGWFAKNSVTNIYHGRWVHVFPTIRFEDLDELAHHSLFNLKVPEAFESKEGNFSIPSASKASLVRLTENSGLTIREVPSHLVSLVSDPVLEKFFYFELVSDQSNSSFSKNLFFSYFRKDREFQICFSHGFDEKLRQAAIAHLESLGVLQGLSKVLIFSDVS